jgi:flagellar biosynthesis GTPase FlhF
MVIVMAKAEKMIQKYIGMTSAIAVVIASSGLYYQTMSSVEAKAKDEVAKAKDDAAKEVAKAKEEEAKEVAKAKDDAAKAEALAKEKVEEAKALAKENLELRDRANRAYTDARTSQSTVQVAKLGLMHDVKVNTSATPAAPTSSSSS